MEDAGGDTKSGYSITLAPLVVKDKVIVGVGGGEYGIRGFIAAYDAETGKEVWRFYTIPGPGETGHETWEAVSRRSPTTFCDPEAWKHGGGSIWLTGSYDPQLNLTYWGVGNAGPDYNGAQRPGDNLYTDSVVALDADTGTLKWHYQFTPHDVYDYDAVQIPVLVDNWAGTRHQRRGLGQPQRQLLRARSRDRDVPARDAVREGQLDERVRRARAGRCRRRSRRASRPTRATRAGPTGTRRPSVRAPASSTSPAWEDYATIYGPAPVRYKEGDTSPAAVRRLRAGAGRAGPRHAVRSTTGPKPAGHGAVIALDPATGEQKWKFAMTDVTDSGILTTASEPAVHRRAGRLLPGAGRAHRRAAVEDATWRRHQCGADDVSAGQQAICGRGIGAVALRLRTRRVAEDGSRRRHRLRRSGRWRSFAN